MSNVMFNVSEEEGFNITPHFILPLGAETAVPPLTTWWWLYYYYYCIYILKWTVAIGVFQ